MHTENNDNSNPNLEQNKQEEQNPPRKSPLKPTLILAGALLAVVALMGSFALWNGRAFAQLFAGDETYARAYTQKTAEALLDYIFSLPDAYEDTFRGTGSFSINADVPSAYVDKYVLESGSYIGDSEVLLGIVKALLQAELTMDAGYDYSSALPQASFSGQFNVGQADLLDYNFIIDGDELYISSPQIYSRPFLYNLADYTYGASPWASFDDYNKLMPYLRDLEPMAREMAKAALAELEYSLLKNVAMPLDNTAVKVHAIRVAPTEEELSRAAIAALKVLRGNDSYLQLISDFSFDFNYYTGGVYSVEELRSIIGESIDNLTNEDADNEIEVFELELLVGRANNLCGFHFADNMYTEFGFGAVAGQGYRLSWLDDDSEAGLTGSLKKSGGAYSGSISIFSEGEVINLGEFSELKFSKEQASPITSLKAIIYAEDIVNKDPNIDEGLAELLRGWQIVYEAKISGKTYDVAAVLQNPSENAQITLSATQKMGAKPSPAEPPGNAIRVDPYYGAEELNYEEMMDNLLKLADKLGKAGYPVDYFYDALDGIW